MEALPHIARQLLATSGAFAWPLLSHAITVPEYRNVPDFVNRVLCPIGAYMFMILMVVGTIMVLVAAYLYLTAGGDSEKVSKATKTITYAAVAIIVAILARSFPVIVGAVVGARGIEACS